MELSFSRPNLRVSLPPDISYFNVNDDFLYVKRDNVLFKISQRGSKGIPLTLFDFLREPKKLTEIGSILSDFRYEDVLNIIRKLHKLGLLKIETERKPIAPENRVRQSYVVTTKTKYVFRASITKARYHKRLANKRVLLIGDGILANKLFSRLEKLKVGSISLMTKDDLIKHSIDHVGRCDLIVAAEDYQNFVLFDALNRLCFVKQKPWLRISFDGSIGYLGPLVIPGNTCCYNCCRLRLAANSPNYEYLLWRYRNSIPKTGLMVLEDFADIVSTMGADDIKRYLTKYQEPLTLDCLISVDTRKMHVSYHKIIAHPYCIHCNPFTQKRQLRLDHLKGNTTMELSNGKTKGLVSDLTSSLLTVHGASSANELLIRLQELIDDKTGIILTSRKIFSANPLGIKGHHFFNAICSSVPTIGLTEDAHPGTPKEKVREIIYSNSGSGYSPQQAELRALMESVERYSSVMADQSSFRWAAYDDVKKTAISPTDLILYPDKLYEKHDFKCSQFSPYATIPWIDGHVLVSGKPILIPADFVYAPLGRKPLVFSTSNGAAAHTDKVLAILNGLFEVIERDAFLTMWLNKLSMPILKVKTLPLSFKESISLINNFGMEVKLVDLTNDTIIPTVMAVCYNKSAYRYPGLVIGIGTHVEPEKAIQKALFEMEISLLDVLEKSRKRKIRFHSISRPYDHKVLYLSPAMRKHWYFMINSKNEIHQLRTMKRPKKNNSNKILFQVARRLHRMNHNVIYCDITPVDMRNIGLSAVKVFVTGLQPLYFGNDPRLSLQRLMAVPVRLGYRSKPSNVFEMNPLPHPLP